MLVSSSYSSVLLPYSARKLLGELLLVRLCSASAMVEVFSAGGWRMLHQGSFPTCAERYWCNCTDRVLVDLQFSVDGHLFIEGSEAISSSPESMESVCLVRLCQHG